MEEEDFKLLLSEYTRLAASSPNFTDNLHLIPILLKYGAFTPSRLERWPLDLVVSEMERNPDYRLKVSEAFSVLISGAEESPVFTLNEKKAIAFLLAARQGITDILSLAPRIQLAVYEYASVPDILELSNSIPLPFPNASTLAPKLNVKFPLFMQMTGSPSIDLAKSALQRLFSDPANVELAAVLNCAARVLDPKTLYSEILQPAWTADNEQVLKIVLKALSSCPELHNFCKEYM